MQSSQLTREEIILLALQDGESYSPVQLQKLLFLIDKEATNLNTPFFDFQPYDYGPFDKEVYNTCDELWDEDLLDVECESGSKYRKYCLTDDGITKANEIANKVNQQTNDYIKQLAQFVRKHSFTELVSAIYNAYPDMKVNSVFNK